jgi:hypothetical protein
MVLPNWHPRFTKLDDAKYVKIGRRMTDLLTGPAEIIPLPPIPLPKKSPFAKQIYELAKE